MSFLDFFAEERQVLKSFSIPSIFDIDKPFFSEQRKKEINNEFNKHDGYFSKLVINNKVIGYIFRCVHKDVILKDTINNKECVIPFFITCVYQPALLNIKNETSKLLGKDHALKTGVRLVKQYVDKTGDLDLIVFKENAMDVNKVFPVYTEMMDNTEFDPEFWEMTEEEYKNTVDYIKTFDEKTYKYYNNIDKEKIVKIWIRN